MTANGAKGNTLAQMEDVFGIQVAELNPYLHAYFKALLQVRSISSVLPIPSGSEMMKGLLSVRIFCRLMQIGTMQASIKPHLMTLP